MEGEKGAVCVTGGAGYIASWLIMRLLDHGYSVRTTVRPNPEHNEDPSFLKSVPGAAEKLKIFYADLDDPESFGAAIEGCVGVFHVATPVDFVNKEAEEIVTKRSVDGAIGILKACLDSKTVKKVVYTSSSSAVFINGKNLEKMDESFWSDTDYIRTLNWPLSSYAISKALTERAVLEFSEKQGLEVVTLIPTYVVGPFICPKLPSSIQILLDSSDEPINIDMVHVDDVARAHIFLFEHPEAKGRYICSSITTTIKSVFELLSIKYPELQARRKNSEMKIECLKLPSASSKKLRDSGFEFKYGVEEMFDGAIKCCKEKGYL